MNIIAIIDSLQGGGAERVFSLLTTEWARAGHTVEIITFKDSTLLDETIAKLTLLPPINPRGTSGRSLIRKMMRLPTLLVRLRRNIVRSKPDLVICFMDQANILTLIATIGIKVPVAVCERIYPAYSSLFTSTKNPLMRGFFSLLRWLTYRRASRIILQSDRSISFFPASLQPKICVIPNPILPPAAEGLPIEIPQPVILSIGRLTPQKRFDLVIDAFHQLTTEFPDWRLLIAGSGSELANLERRAAAGAGATNIHFLGYQGNTASLFNQSSLFVLASDYEGFPVSLGEALISGVPSIATDCLTGPREMLADNEYGLLTPVGDANSLYLAMKRVISDRSLSAHYAEAGRRRAEQFTLEKILPLWGHAMEEITNKNGYL